MSRLVNLPHAIREEIMRYLLLASRVTEAPNHLMVQHYAFEVNLLRVSQAIKDDAEAVLYGENRFVKVNSNFVDVKKSMLNHEVPFFNLKSSVPFKHHVADITAAISSFNQRLSHLRTNEVIFFLILLEDVPKYTRTLRLLDLANFMGYEFCFKLQKCDSAGTILTSLEQSKLLMPFKQLRGGAMVQTVRFIGPFDATLVETLREAMTQKVAWLRSGVWEVHDIALSIKRVGDSAFRMGNADIASAKYDDVKSFLTSALALNSMMKGVDSRCEKAMSALMTTTYADMALLLLSDCCREEVPLETAYRIILGIKDHAMLEKFETNTAEKDPIVAHTVLARFLFLIAIAELGLGHRIKAAKAFARSYKLVSDGAEATRNGYLAAKSWNDLDNNTRRLKLQSAIASCPKEPLTIPDMGDYSTPEVSSEQWVMRELGFKGPFPHGDKIKGAMSIVLTNEPHRNHHNQGPRTACVGEVKPDVLRKHVARCRKRMTLPIAQGSLICWVSLGMNDIGEETFLDHLDSMPNGCPSM